VANRFVSTIFCDDVRREDGGKLSFMGIYPGNLVVSSFPATISKICIIVTVHTPSEQTFETVKINVFNGDVSIADALMEGESVIEAMNQALKTTETGAEDWIAMRCIFEIANMQILSSEKLLATVVVDGEALKGGALRMHALNV